MIYAISLCQTDMAEDNFDQVIYTSKVASFEYEHPAMEFAEGKDDIMLIDDAGRILKDASIIVEVEK